MRYISSKKTYFTNKAFLKRVLIYLNVFLLYSCSGTIQTVRHIPEAIPEYKNAYIISAEKSQYIEFNFGIITPYVYIVPPDGPSEDHEIIGNTDLVIKSELEKYGINVEIGEKGNIPKDIDLIVLYKDTWRWDFKDILDRLEIVFISPYDKKEIAKSTYNIYGNKEFHDFPSPEKEVPKMIKELLNK